MIYSRFGSRVKQVVGGDMDAATIDVIFEGETKVFKGYIRDFKADGGLGEIEDAIKAVAPSKE